MAIPMSSVALRRIPSPYRAILAICSDLDETPDRSVYWESLRFLNTTERTAMGQGVGLEIGNSIYFDMPAQQFSYWNTDDSGRAMVRALIHSGHIDCLHSFGDLATTRVHAERALAELSRYQCQLGVWIDHAVAPSNFDGDIMRGVGDVPGSPVYHADLTCDFGVQYVWRGRVTSVIGQNVSRSLRGIYTHRRVISSIKTVAREYVKGVLAQRGHAKYAMHGPNQVLRATQLRDGQPVWEFLRSNPHWGGVSCGETAAGLADVLSESMLTRLIKREGVCVLYTHLGKIKKYTEPFGPRTREALRRLAGLVGDGKILVASTRRVLDYCRTVSTVKFSTVQDGAVTGIDITMERQSAVSSRQVLSELSGLSFYVADPRRTQVRVNGQHMTELQYNSPDHTGRPSISFPWRRLELPAL